MADRLTRGELASWLGYLGDIGVRELGGPIPKKRPRTERRATASAPASARSRGRSRPAPNGAPPAASTEGLTTHDPTAELSAAGDLAAVRTTLGECGRCKLHATRKTIVFGVGDPNADLMFVGEGPGADEDARGEPFVGRAGKKLDEMIAAIGLRREDVYIANIVKCRPPGNRDPQPDEVGACSPFLFAQIAAIRPTVIVTLGSPAARTLLGTKVGITRLRGTWQEFRGTPVMPTYHPAYLLRAYTRENRRKVYDDLLAAKSRIQGGE